MTVSSALSSEKNFGHSMLLIQLKKNFCVCVWSAVTHSSGHFLTAASCRRKVTPFVFCPPPPRPHPGQGPESSLGAQETTAHSSCLHEWNQRFWHTFLYLDFYTQVVYYIFFFLLGHNLIKIRLNQWCFLLFLSSAL